MNTPRRALVTGGTKGIGLAIARRLSADVFNLTLLGRDRDVLESVSREFGAAFAVAVALISCRAGLTARGGASAVGDAAKNAVVRAALVIVALDLIVARALG